MRALLTRVAVGTLLILADLAGAVGGATPTLLVLASLGLAVNLARARPPWFSVQASDDAPSLTVKQSSVAFPSTPAFAVTNAAGDGATGDGTAAPFLYVAANGKVGSRYPAIEVGAGDGLAVWPSSSVPLGGYVVLSLDIGLSLQPGGVLDSTPGAISVSSFVHHVSGSGRLHAIHYPPTASGIVVGLQVTFIPDGAWSAAPGGNIGNGMTATPGVPVVATFDGSRWFLR